MPLPSAGRVDGYGVCGREQCVGDEVGEDLVQWDGEEEKAPARVMEGWSLGVGHSSFHSGQDMGGAGQGSLHY